MSYPIEWTKEQLDELERQVKEWSASASRHRINLLPRGVNYAPLPAKACSYCRAAVAADRENCKNCGAPVVIEDLRSIITPRGIVYLEGHL